VRTLLALSLTQRRFVPEDDMSVHLDAKHPLPAA